MTLKKKPSKNDFRKQEVKDKALYKLWMKIKDEELRPGENQTFTRYSFPTKGEHEQYNYLLNLISKNKDRLAIARIYNNQNKSARDPMQEWDTETLKLL